MTVKPLTALVVALGAALVMAGCGLFGAGGKPAAHPAAAGSAARARLPPRLLGASVSRAYQFLDQMMDRYGAGATPRFVQSYIGGLPGAPGLNPSIIYDDAVLIDAYVAEGTPGGLARAKIIGAAFLDAQAANPLRNGSLFDAYSPVPLGGSGYVQATDQASHTGSMAWAGLALTELFAATGMHSYLDGAVAIGDRVQADAWDNRGAGGYTGGSSMSGTKIEWKSTEHNIDLYAFFRLLARETGNPVWTARAGWARAFIVRMWDGRQGRFYVGTATDGTSLSNSVPTEDVNSWSYLALQDPAYAASVGWDVRHLSVTAGGFSGVSICPGDRTGVWFEGTAHLAEALALGGEGAQASAYLSDIGHAQAHGPNADGRGIMAASRNRLGDCAGGYVDASLHTGTTAWFILAAKSIDPLSAVPVSAQRGG